MSLNLPLPKHIAAHGWWTRDGEKMSKSKGNVVDPREVANHYGVENFRYFMMREVPFGQDGDFSQRALIDRMNSDLSNDLGNLLNRIIGMSEKYSALVIDSDEVAFYHSQELHDAHAIVDSLPTYLHELQLHRYLEELWKVFTIGNKAIEEHAPWVKIKEGRTNEALATVALVANLLAKASLMLHAIMPKTTATIADALGFEITTESYTHLILNKGVLETFTIKKIPPLFPRVEEPLMQEAPKAMSEEKTPVVENPKMDDKKTTTVSPEGLITIDQFFQTSLKIGTVLNAQEVPKSTKLLKLHVDIGEETPRQIIAGIREYYSAQSLIGTQVCVVANLKPAKLMGLLSEGMLLAAKDAEGLSLIRPEKSRSAGSSIG
jgi:methionyl-tRNA synthetase